jgi:hypothetical protein
MSNGQEYYIVIVEHKTEEPIILETFLRQSDEKSARNRMGQMMLDPRIIRCAIAKIVFVDGNKDLLK